MKPGIILYSTADWNNPFWTNKQHMACHLAARGFCVLYIESLGLRRPTLKAQDLSRILKRLISFFKGKRQVRENIWVYSPIVIPLGRYKFIQKINALILKTSLRFFKWQLGFKEHWAWTYNPTVSDLAVSLCPSKIVYHSVDDLSASPGMDAQWIQQEESKLLAQADHVFCTSKKIFEHCRSQAGQKVHYFPNVVDVDHFKKAQTVTALPSDLENIPKPRIGFIGAISSYKVDFQMLNLAARKHPEWSFVMIGKIGEGQPETETSLLSLPNIYLIGPRDYKILPEYLAGFDVAMIPCPINDYTQSMFPMKFFEYLAAGKKVVAPLIDSLREFTQYFFIIKENDLSQTVDQALNSKTNSSQINQLVQEYTWEKRLTAMLDIIDSKKS